MDAFTLTGADEHLELDRPTSTEIAETITELAVFLAAGRVSVLADPAVSGAEIEVSALSGEPLHVARHGHRLSIGYQNIPVLSLLRPGKNRSVDLTVRVAPSADVAVSTASADVLIAGAQAGSVVNTASGDVALHDVSGRIVTRSVSGRVEATGVSGDVDVSSTSGDVTVAARRFDGLSVRNVSGDLVLDLAEVPDGPVGRVRMHTVSGSATARIPAGSGYNLRAHTVSGTVVAGGQRLSRFGGADLREGDERFFFEVNSVSGDVTLLTSAAATAGTTVERA